MDFSLKKSNAEGKLFFYVQSSGISTPPPQTTGRPSEKRQN
jgi:hypothetical protein